MFECGFQIPDAVLTERDGCCILSGGRLWQRDGCLLQRGIYDIDADIGCIQERAVGQECIDGNDGLLSLLLTISLTQTLQHSFSCRLLDTYASSSS